MEIVQDNSQMNKNYMIDKKVIQDLYMDFNGDIMGHNIKICILIMKIKVLINYKILLMK